MILPCHSFVMAEHRGRLLPVTLLRVAQRVGAAGRGRGSSVCLCSSGTNTRVPNVCAWPLSVSVAKLL